MTQTPQNPISKKSEQRPTVLRYSKTTEKTSDQTITVFDEKFSSDNVHNSCCLTSDGCMSRHHLPRKNQYMSRSESRAREFNTFNRASFEDQQLISMVAELQSKGLILKSDETLEQYVERNQDELSDESFERLERSKR